MVVPIPAYNEHLSLSLADSLNEGLVYVLFLNGTNGFRGSRESSPTIGTTVATFAIFY